MDKNEFDKIMYKYVASTAKGMEEDFIKLNKEEEKRASVVKQPRKKLVWIPITAGLAIVLLLAIMLPLLFKSGDTTEDPDTSMMQYFESTTLEMIIVEDMLELSEQYDIFGEFPTIVYQEAAIKILQSSASELEVVGAYLNLAVYDDFFDTIELYVIPENNILDSLVHYESLSKEALWGNTTVKYFIEYNETGGSFCGKLYYHLDDYKYYLEVVYYEELDIPQILELIYFKKISESSL